jgi:hypothetical protein
VKAGKMRVLGVMDSQRLAQVPDAPTFKEQGYDIEALLWYSLSVPAATPKDVIDRLNRAVNQVIADPDFVARAPRHRHGAARRHVRGPGQIHPHRIRPLGAAAAKPEPAQAGALS